jgi:hypothetical protein
MNNRAVISLSCNRMWGGGECAGEAPAGYFVFPVAVMCVRGAPRTVKNIFFTIIII